jgi:hypothetical protein
MQEPLSTRLLAEDSGALAPEPELVLLCACTRLVPEIERRIGELLSLKINWDRVLRMARRHRILPLLYLNLKKLKTHAIPATIFAELRLQFLSNAARNLQLSDELMKLMSALEREKIPAIPFKGLALASEVYGDVSYRDAGDLDLLVHRQDIVRAVDLLETLGHRPIFPTSTPREAAYLRTLTPTRRQAYLRAHSEHHLVREDGLVNVDLHWAVALREFFLPIDTDGIWRRAGSAVICGRQVPALSTEDLLLVLCVNGAKDCWERLDRVCDVAELLRHRPELDWQQVSLLAGSVGAMRMLLLGLELAATLLGTPLPSNMAEAIERDTQVAELARGISDDLMADPSAQPGSRSRQQLFQLRLRERRLDRVGYCLAHLRPGVGDWASLSLPWWLGFLYYFLRPIRLLARYGAERATFYQSRNVG